MKKLLFGLFLCLGTVFVVFSCQKDLPTNSTNTSTNKGNGSGGFRTYTPISKGDYLALSLSEKRAQWVSKFEYVVANETLNPTQKSLIEQLIDDLNAMQDTDSIFSGALDTTAMLLVDEFSETDFINMFARLEVISVSEEATPTCTSCMSSLTGGNFQWNSIGGIYPTCNCDWTCGDEWAETSCVNPNCCLPTTSGCGLLWAFPCDGYDSLF